MYACFVLFWYSDSKRDGIGCVGGLYDDEDESELVPDVYLSVYLSRGAPVCGWRGRDVIVYPPNSPV